MNKNTTKTIELSKQSVPYKVIRNNRSKNIRLYVNVLGELEVRIPKRVKEDSISEILMQHSKWILKHLSNRQQKKEFYYLGRKLNVVQSFDMFGTINHFKLKDNVLNIISPCENSLTTNDLFEMWLKQEAMEYIPARTAKLAEQYGFVHIRITIRSQKSRWGSCSANGSLSFNSRLMKFDKDVIDYVIVHELCHLKEMNHSKKFWKLVGEIIPEYKYFVKRLRSMIFSEDMPKQKFNSN
ncbi:MAG: M48 family metallopeptidase [Ignavibacteriales bacterium]|nr:MAG: M48 family metallopeptidase [Ignavibacteriales bacterium]